MQEPSLVYLVSSKLVLLIVPVVVHCNEMRKPKLSWTNDSGLELLAKAETIHLATTTTEGQPVLRALHAVLVDGVLAFHGAKAGEKALCLGRTSVASAHRVLANVPSYFIDPERACPATTYYQSVQVKGQLVEVEDLDKKANVIAALMEKYQPEGGYADIDSASPLYENALRGLLVYGIRIESITAKQNLGQHRNGDEARLVLEGLWQRGLPEDLIAIDCIAKYRCELGEALPTFLRSPPGTTFRCQLGKVEQDQVVNLLQDAYWNQSVGAPEIASVHDYSTAWVGVVDECGQVIASARAVTDGIKFGWILDVIVEMQWRGQGIGTALFQFLLQHPRMRGCRNIGLGTKDAQAFYEKFGFRESSIHPESGVQQMLLLSNTSKPSAKLDASAKHERF